MIQEQKEKEEILRKEKEEKEVALKKAQKDIER